VKRYINVAAFVLAGGASRRMGQDKALLELGGLPMVVRTVRLVAPLVASVTVVAPPERYGSLGLCRMADRWPGAGPLGGIITALGVSSADWNLILGCDLPFLTTEWIDWIISRALNSSAKAVVPKSLRGIEPLAAMYHNDCGPVFAAAFERGVRSVSEALGEIVFDRITADQWHALDPAGALLKNINTRGDFVEAQHRVSKEL
jgi:molybdopterin-guanine dinucleotide biosynthesis protein A